MRKVSIIAPGEAEVVRSIFRQYADGIRLAEIADGLNRIGIPAPYDAKKRSYAVAKPLRYTKPAGRGWGHTTVGAILANERYLRRFTRNVREWYRHPETGRRGPRPRRVCPPRSGCGPSGTTSQARSLPRPTRPGRRSLAGSRRSCSRRGRRSRARSTTSPPPENTDGRPW